MTVAGGWAVRRLEGSADDLHHRGFPDGTERLIEVCRVTRPALVLGSTQSTDLVDLDAAASAGLEVTGRRSGGGAVLLDPAGSVWIDVTLPRGDELWDDDVNRSFLWLGERWVAALASFGLAGEVHRRGLERSAWSSLVCFASTGPGEVCVEGRKVVGISQRRTRAAARFQSVVYVASMPPAAGIVDLLVQPVDDGARRALRAHLDVTVGEVPAPAAVVAAAFITALG